MSRKKAKVYLGVVGLVLCLLIVIVSKQERHSVRFVTSGNLNITYSFVTSKEVSQNGSKITHKTTKKSQPVMVLVLTYMRSGSSLTGDILQQSPGAFYVYEPFRAIAQENHSTFVIMYANGTKRYPPYSYKHVMAEMLSNWFTCRISDLPYIGLFDNFLNNGLKTSIFQTCLKQFKNKTNSSHRLFRFCKGQLQKACLLSPIRIIKTIRVPMSLMEPLLQALPSLKVIHLVRDPRATLLSQARYGMCNRLRGGWYGCASKYCTTVENDILDLEYLSKRYADRLLQVQYEDIARDPMKMSKKMFDFIGSELTSEARVYIYNITQAGNPNNCGICTTRSNSSEHIDLWKKEMPIYFKDVVNERCNFVIKRYGYEIV